MNFIKAVLSAAFCLVASMAMAVPITFGNFTGTFPYAENGFSVTPTQTPKGGSWGGASGAIVAGAPGIQNPNPFAGPGIGAGVATIEMACGGLFFFNSVDLLGSAHEDINFSITGLLNGKTMFTDSGQLDTFEIGNPYNLIGGNPSMVIDSLFITGNWDPTFSAGFAVDDIDVTRVSDSSSTLALLGVSASALLIYGRRQQFMTKR
jgi:hypothetical protein